MFWRGAAYYPDRNDHEAVSGPDDEDHNEGPDNQVVVPPILRVKFQDTSPESARNWQRWRWELNPHAPGVNEVPRFLRPF
jgi:hypothetical protein